MRKALITALVSKIIIATPTQMGTHRVASPGPQAVPESNLVVAIKTTKHCRDIEMIHTNT